MSMYVVQVKPGTDLQVAVLLRKNGHLVRCPQRTMDIRKNGKWNSITEPVFPGYLFLEEEIDRQKYDSVVQSDGVIGFLKVSGCTLGKLSPTRKHISGGSGTAANPLPRPASIPHCRGTRWSCPACSGSIGTMWCGWISGSGVPVCGSPSADMTTRSHCR